MSNSIEKYLESKGYSKTTIASYNTGIINYIVWCDQQNLESNQATSTDITSYLQHLQKKSLPGGRQGLHNKTRNIQLNIIKHYYNYLIHIETRTDNPARQIKLRGTKTKNLYPIFTKQELEAIYHNYKLLEPTDERNNRNWFNNTMLSKQRNKAILSLMIYQALTTDEVNRLTLKDIKLKEGKIYIAGTRKSEERELDLKSHQIMELMEYQLTTRIELLKQQNTQTDFYFIPTLPTGKTAHPHKTINTLAQPVPTLRDQKISTTINIWKRLSGELKETHPKFINFLQVRASVITHWLKQHNLRQVQYMAGHRYVSTTETYLVNNIEDLQKDIENYHPIG